MKIFAGGRSNGKTYKLVQLLKKDPDGILVTKTDEMARYFRDTYDLQKGQVISIGQLRTHRGITSNLYIDEVGEELPNYIINSYNVSAISVAPPDDLGSDVTLDYQIRITEWQLDRLKAKKKELND